MDFPTPLKQARLLRRYKRFLADVEFADGETITAHCPNPGSMLSLIGDTADQTVWLSHSDDPKRKLAWTMELLEIGGVPVCVNTQRPNRVVEEAVRQGRIPELTGYQELRREVRYGEGSRIDLLLASPDRPDCYVEIKSATLSRSPGLIEFPDSVTKRGARHLDELSAMSARGHRAVLFLLSPRPDGKRFAPASDIDPAWAESLKRAVAAGVEVICYTCAVSPTGLYPADPVPVIID